MKIVPVIAASLLALGSLGGAAQAKGCLKGAVVGGVAGHFANHHPLLGAAAGCMVGHHYATKHERERRAAAARPHR